MNFIQRIWDKFRGVAPNPLIEEMMAMAEQYEKVHAENLAHLKAVQAEEDEAWALRSDKQEKVVAAWHNYIAALREAYPGNIFYDYCPGYEIEFRKARSVIVNDDPLFTQKIRPDLPRKGIADVADRAIMYGYGHNYPKVNPNDFNVLA